MLRSSLALRFIILTSLLILATSMTLSIFFLTRLAEAQDYEEREDGVSMARNLAHNAELAVLTRNASLLHELGVGIFQEEEVIGVTVVDTEGNPLMDEWRRRQPSRDLVARPSVQTILVGAGEVRITPFAMPGSRKIEAYEVSCPVFTRRGTRHNEEIGFLLEEEESSNHRLETIGYARVMLSLAGMHRNIRNLTLALGAITFLVIAVGILLTIMLVRRMVAPVRALAEATRRIACGSLDEVVPEPVSQDEIGQLASSFNQMTGELRRSRHELERHSADLEDQVRMRTRELEEAQSKLVQAEKMSAVGLLVSGVAHELNNPLAGVVGYSQLLLKANAEERVRRGLEKINREAERCKKIVQNLQTFARKHKPQKDYVGINGILDSTLELRAYQLKVDNISVETDFDADLPKTMADFHQLQQVFLNIIINAHQAMVTAGRKGALTLRTRRKGNDLVVEIEDNGPGIPQENLGKIFDPFFTTKEVGQGTGLGLSICYGIIEEHRGRISVRNGPGGGAIFTVVLPVLEPEPDRIPAADEPAEKEGAPAGRRNILVVDDELAIIDILYQVLRMDGHRVDTALNGTVALRKIEKEQYDVIISDLKMPGMGGRELYERIRETNLDLARRIIFSTGDVVSSDTREFLEKSGNNYLQKPFDTEAIRRIVRSVMVTSAR